MKTDYYYAIVLFLLVPTVGSALTPMSHVAIRNGLADKRTHQVEYATISVSYDSSIARYDSLSENGASTHLHIDSTIIISDSTKPSIVQRQSLWGRVIAPLAVTALAGGALLLLYLQRGH
jgi:hypothetical protein